MKLEIFAHCMKENGFNLFTQRGSEVDFVSGDDEDLVTFDLSDIENHVKSNSSALHLLKYELSRQNYDEKDYSGKDQLFVQLLSAMKAYPDGGDKVYFVTFPLNHSPNKVMLSLQEKFSKIQVCHSLNEAREKYDVGCLLVLSPGECDESVVLCLGINL